MTIINELDPHSPIPLYHQIAEALRLKVLSGELQPGVALPTLKQAARDWGVHLHTIRHAYVELAREGLVESRPAAGTRVLERASTSSPAMVRSLVGRMVAEAGRHGIGPTELARHLLDWPRSPESGLRIAHVVECSLAQCTDLAAQLAALYDVHAVPWSLENTEPPPDSPLLATYFHYNEIRRRWPHRLNDTAFVGIKPDPALRNRFPAAACPVLTVCEWDGPTAETVAADLSVLFPAPRRIEPRVIDDAAAALGDCRSPLLFSPRVWATLRPADRQHPHAFELRYVFDPEDLANVASRLHWQSLTTSPYP